MRFLKEKKGIIISFIIGIIIASSITVYAYSYFASDISYTKQGSSTAISVGDALDELYARNISSTTLKLIKSNCRSDVQNTVDLSNEEGYDNFSEDNFLVVLRKIIHKSDATESGDYENLIELSYDKNNGNLTIPKSQVHATASKITIYAIYDVYLIK